MSSNGETNTVLRGVTHGAVDFLIKPVRLEELRNLWQHVVRRRKDLVGGEGGNEGKSSAYRVENVGDCSSGLEYAAMPCSQAMHPRRCPR